MMPRIMRSYLQKAMYLAIIVLCSTCLFTGCQTVPTNMSSGGLIEIATAKRDSAQCRDYAFQAVVNGQKEVIHGKACPRSQGSK
jgi:surface antigen